MPMEPIVIAYVIIYLLAFMLAIWNRKSFPLNDSIMVILIIGVGFTGLVYISTLWVKATPITDQVPAGQFAFTLVYLLFVAILLVFRVIPQHWKETFFKEKIATLLYKLFVFVLLPIIALRLFWNSSWPNLGFSPGDVRGQLLTVLVLTIFLGGFNLFVGSAAAPIRAGQFSGRQLTFGFLITFVWNIFEVGLVEEFFFRGFVQTRLINFLGSPLSGICLASLLFGLAHAPGIYLRGGDKLGPLGEHPSLLNSILYAVVVLSPTGWFTGLLFWRTQSLLAPILIHAAVDTVAHTAEFIEGLRIRK